MLAGCSSGGSSTEGSGGDGGAEPTDPDESSGDGSSGAAQTDTVEMTDELTFEPETIEVSVGTEVTWENVGALAWIVVPVAVAAWRMGRR